MLSAFVTLTCLLPVMKPDEDIDNVHDVAADPVTMTTPEGPVSVLGSGCGEAISGMLPEVDNHKNKSLMMMNSSEPDHVVHTAEDTNRNCLTEDPNDHDVNSHNNDVSNDKCDAENKDMAGQILQLQDMVVDMKQGFSSALEALSQIQYGDQVLQERVSNNKREYESQLADVVQMVLSLKTEFGSVVSQLKTATENQSRLQRHVECLQYERDIMLEELERTGTISSHVRQKYHSGRSRPNGLNRSSDSTTLSALLERAHNVFNSPTNHNVSDRDSGVNTYRGDHGDVYSCGDVTPPGVNPMVHSYIAGLQDSIHHVSSQGLHSSYHHMSCHEDLPGAAENYDSDSSLTQAANKSLDLSRSLGDKCAQAAMVESSDEGDVDVEGDKAQDAEDGGRDNNNGEKNDEEKSLADKDRKNRSELNHSQGTEMSDRDEPMDQSVFVQPLTPKRIAPHERNTKEVQRLRVAREVMETERKYCSNLWTILDLYVGPLHSTGILSAKETSIMFPSCLTTIYDHHCGFLQKLEERLSNWRYHTILGDVLCRFLESTECDLLLQYQTYVSDFPASLYQIRKSCKHSARFRKFLRVMQRHQACEGLDIGSFMVTPIQRIPRYVLLLKQLLKYTDRDHPDHYYIQNALDKLGDFLEKLNGSIEYSMRMVGSNPESPKPKRKLRIGSFRSTSVTSCDNAKLNDTSMTGEEPSVLSTSTSHSRFFNFSFLRESFRRKQSQIQVNHSYSTPLHSQIPPVILDPQPSDTPARGNRPPSAQSRHPDLSYSHLNHSGSMQHDSFSRLNALNTSLRDQSFLEAREHLLSTGRSQSMRSDKKRRPRHKRSRAGLERHGSAVGPDIVDARECELSGAVDSGSALGSQGGPPEHKRPCKLRHHSQHRQRTSFQEQQASDVSSRHSSAAPWSRSSSQESFNTLTGDAQTTSSGSSSRPHPAKEQHLKPGSTEHLRPASGPYEMTEMAQSLPDISVRTAHSAARSSGRKLPVPPKTHSVGNDYGIYGDTDDMDEQEEEQSVPCAQNSRHQTLQVPSHTRSASHGYVPNGYLPGSPSQRHINLALARSLAENRVTDSGPYTVSHTLPTRTTSSLLEVRPPRPSSQNSQSSLRISQRPQVDRPRPHSAKPRTTTLRDDSRSQTLDLNSTAPVSVLTIADSLPVASSQNGTLQLTPKKDLPSKRKKDRPAKKVKEEPLDIDGEKDKKKASIKDSLKSIFFRKRGSKMLDIAPLEEFPENGHQVYNMAIPYSASPVQPPTVSGQTTGGKGFILISGGSENEVKAPRAQDPPLESHVILEPVDPELETYEDENGDPCSAV